MRKEKCRSLIVGLALTAALFFAVPISSIQAQVQPRGDAKDGRVLQASTGVIEHVYDDALDLQLTPTDPSLNGSASLKITVKPAKLQAADANQGFTVSGTSPSTCGVLSCSTIFSVDVQGTSAQTQFISTKDLFGDPGAKQIDVKVSSQFTSFNSTRSTYKGSLKFTLKPEDAANAGKLSMALTSETRAGQTVVKTFSVSAQGAAKYEYDCGNGTEKGSNTSNTASSYTFKCNYPLTPPKNYTVKATAYDTSGKVMDIKSQEVKVTGTEGQQGENAAQNQISSSTDVLGWIGGTLLGVVNKLLGAIVAALNELIFLLFFYFVGPFIEALLAIHTYTDNFASIIYPAWEIFRNLGNIIFILAIIATGLATVFRVGGWQAKDILVKLIVGAIFINFSLVLAQSVLGIADTVQGQFLPADSGAIRLLADKLFIQNFTKSFNELVLTSSKSFGTFGESVRIIAAFIGSFVAFIAFAAIAAFLAIRIVFLWLLLMTSPLPYVAMALPITRSLTQRWWSNFIKYAFMTPAMAFMINLSALVAEKNQTLINKLSDRQYAHQTPTVENVMFNLGANAIVLVFLFVSLKVASMIGAESGGLIEKVSDQGWRAAFAPVGAAKYGIGALGGYANRWKTEKTTPWARKGLLGKAAFSILNPGAVKEAWVARREERDKQIHHTAQGAADDLIKDAFNEPGTDGQAHAFMHGAKEKAADNPYLSERATGGNIKNILQSGKASSDLNTRMELIGQVINLSNEKGLNYMLSEGKSLGFGKNYDASRKGYVQWMNDMVNQGIMSKEEAGHLGAELSANAYKTKEYWYAEGYGVNHHGHPTMIETDTAGEPMGATEYGAVSADIETAIEAQVTADATARGGTTTDADALMFRRNNRSKITNEVLHHLEESTNSADKRKFHAYENYKTYVGGITEGVVNFNKVAPQQKARDVHWSFAVDVAPNGDHKFNEYGVASIVEADSGDYGQGSQLQPKKRAALRKGLETPAKEAATLNAVHEYIKSQEHERLIGTGLSKTAADADIATREAAGEFQTKAEKKLQAYKSFYIGAAKYQDAASTPIPPYTVGLP